MTKPKIPYSASFDSYLEDKIYSVNEMLKMHSKDFPDLKCIELIGMTHDSNDSVDFLVVLNSGVTKTCAVKRHVDESALEISKGLLLAHYGLDDQSASEAIEYADDNGIKELDVGLYNQLRSDYIYSSLPHNDGGEFLEQDRELINDLIQDAKEFHSVK